MRMQYYQHLLVFGGICVATWSLITSCWPRLMLSVYKRGLLKRGFGEGPVPVNTLYTQPQRLFADPFAPLPPGSSKLMSYGTNRDTLYVCGWIDLSQGAQVLQVPDMNGRYYSVQLTDPSKNTNFAYVGTRTTGTRAGAYAITGSGWKGSVPQGLKRIPSPNNSVIVIGRVLVENNSDLSAAYGLAKQIQLAPLSGWQSGK